jgi:hypothetical protein
VVSLIDREADLLMRGVKEENLIGLRQRITSLYLQYIKTPEFNPAVSKLLKVPLDITDTTNKTYYCTTCEKYLPSTEFQISSTNPKIGKCRSCKHLENMANQRVDYTKFKYLLAVSKRTVCSRIKFSFLSSKDICCIKFKMTKSCTDKSRGSVICSQ